MSGLDQEIAQQRRLLAADVLVRRFDELGLRIIEVEGDAVLANLRGV